ncbi:MAG: DNA-protecting protein DprA [Ruminococcaceae bacterium]|nr:DNA-protecting protein DprA [Oscillospiraceae bacterium]
MENILYWLWFSFAAGKQRVSANRLLENFSPEQIYKMSKEELRRAGAEEGELLDALSNKDLKPSETELAIANKYNIQLVCPDDEKYPEDLRNIDDSPYVIYRRGTSDETGDDRLRIAIVGSRRASEYGLKIAYELAFELAKRGIVIVSGMATGIDSAAHDGAVDAGGKTIAVLGCGVNLVYPKENSTRMVNIMKNGEVMSEFPFDTPPYRWNFPQRNRMISGLAHGVIVVEAEEISGTAITAKLALEQGKELFAVPGNINSPNSVGTNRLIKNGAYMVTCVDDVLEQFDGFEFENNNTPEYEENIKTAYTEPQESGDEVMAEKIILDTIRVDALTTEEISAKTGLDLPQVNSVVTLLEISGLADALPGHKYIKTSKLK